MPTNSNTNDDFSQELIKEFYYKIINKNDLNDNLFKTNLCK